MTKKTTKTAWHKALDRALGSLILFVSLAGIGANRIEAPHRPIVRAPIETNLPRLLEQEDTNGDKKITVRDRGPRRFFVRSQEGRAYLVEGTYHLANLLQELALARAAQHEIARLKLKELYAPPATRLSRMIGTHYWNQLTRNMGRQGLPKILQDPKIARHGPPRIYVPHSDERGLEYYRQLAREQPQWNLQLFRLPESITPEYVKTLNAEPGLLSLALQQADEGMLAARPFVVPGGRFNELYGWDSYFIALGLLADGRTELARAMVDHFVYQIEHYGKILNANRTYYLTRSQPPFLTSMALAVYEQLPRTPANREWLARAFRAAIKEYRSYWTTGQQGTETGLSRYYGYGLGIPPETEPSHYDTILEPYARKRNMSLRKFAKLYQAGEIESPELDRFFLHDRAMRESGHDTTYRLLGRAAHLNPVSLNSLLYKYEVDIARVIDSIFDDRLAMPDGTVETSASWFERAERRRRLITKYLWNERRGMYFDYNFIEERQLDYVNATTFYPLWAGAATTEQARAVVLNALPMLEFPGGIVASTKTSRGPVDEQRPPRQWDYPFGWAPHQMIAWRGLKRYGFEDETQRLAYRWLFLITMIASRQSGAIVEKYDVVDRTLVRGVEYGNVGIDFEYVSEGGFGWTNASFQVGRHLLSRQFNQSLEALVPPEWIFAEDRPRKVLVQRPF